MGLHWLDMLVVFLYFGLVIWMGIYTMSKVESFDDYAVAGRSVPTAILFATIAATLCGGGATIGRIAFMHKTGIIVFAGLLGVVINQFWSGFFIAGKVREAGKNIYSIGDLYGLYYGRMGRLFSSIVAFLFCLALFGVQILAMGRILQTATGMDIIPAAILSSVITVAYTWSGGMLAVVLTDAVQYVVLAVGISLCGILAMNNAGGYDHIIEVLHSTPEMASKLQLFADWTPLQFLGLFLAFLLGEFCAPYFIQRYATAKSAKESKKGVLIFAGYYGFFLATTAGIGLASLVLQPNVEPGLAMTNLVRDTLPMGLAGIVFGALLAAVMSTGDSFINTAAVIYTRDIYNEFINKAATQKEMLKQSRWATLIIGGGSIAVAVLFQDVFGLMVYVFKLWPSAVLPPLIIALSGKIGTIKISPYAGAPAIVCGLASCLIWGDKVLHEPYGIPANLVGILVNCAVLFIVHMATKNKEPKGAFVPEQLL